MVLKISANKLREIREAEEAFLSLERGHRMGRCCGRGGRAGPSLEKLDRGRR
jgi:hypothetical protein